MNSIIRHGKFIDCIIIVVLWCLAILVVNPLGDFPLNDDWAYATDVKNLLETGVFNPIGWTSMSLFSHVLWGSLWCSIFGFSFEVLRASTLFISLICLWNVYLIGREMGVSRLLALVLAFTLAFNPIYFALSFTFMTEVSFMAFVSLAALFFIRFLKNNSSVNWCLAVLFCIIATLSRQTGLFLPLAFAVVFLLGKIFAQPPTPKGESTRKSKRGGGSPLGVRGVRGQKLATRYSLLAATLPFILSLIALKIFESHMFSTGKIQALYGLQVDELKYLLLNTPEILPLRVLRNIYQMSLYLGLMGLPVWVFLTWKITPHHRSGGFKPTASVILFFPILFLIGVIINDSQMPTLVGILEASGVGPSTFHDAYFLQISRDELPHFFWKIITYASALGAGLMWALVVCGFLFSFKKEKNNTLGMWVRIRRILVKCQTKGVFSCLRFPKCPTSKLVGLFFLLSAAIYFVPFALVGFYDRYLLPLMMVMSLGVVGLLARFLPPAPSKGGESTVGFVSPFGGGLRGRKTPAIITFSLIILMAIFSITSTHDYLAWNRARWQALHDLTIKENIPTTHIDGGFEFGGWYNFHEIEVEIGTQKSWWWVTEDDYVLTFSEIQGYDIHAEYTYDSWWGERRIFVLTKCST